MAQKSSSRTGYTKMSLMEWKKNIYINIYFLPSDWPVDVTMTFGFLRLKKKKKIFSSRPSIIKCSFVLNDNWGVCKGVGQCPDKC